MAVLSSVPFQSATGSVIVLGANGRLGLECVKAFYSEGWNVAAFARSMPKTKKLEHVHYVLGDALEAVQLTQAVKGYDVIINAINVPFGEWANVTPKLTDAVALAAASSGATVVVPGNIYHYGASMPALLSENTLANPTTRLGKVRLAMERAYQSRAVIEGFQTLIVRAGDFLDGRPTGGWFDSQIAKKLHDGKVVYPGHLDAEHTWAYMPDLARAIVAVVGHRDQLPAFHAIGFAGCAITGQELVDGLTATMGKPLKLNGIPWPLLKVAGLFSPNLKCVSEMSYLWNTPHAIDGVAFDALVPEFTHTPLPQALAAVCAQLAHSNS